jgi:hypothetical protein
MSVDWAELARKRNRSILSTNGLLLLAYLVTFGLHWSDARFTASSLWVIYFVAVHLRWKADPKGGGVAIRKELLRQGTLVKHAWAWWHLPTLLGLRLGYWWVWALYLPFGVWGAISFWRTGEALIQRAND